MRQAVVIGTGGHCRVVLSLIGACGRHRILHIIEIGELRPDECIIGDVVTSNVATLTNLVERTDIDVFLAIGNTNTRQHWWARIKELGLPLPNLISPHAIIDPTADLGVANIICAKAFIGPEVKIGENNLINTGSIVEHETFIGNHCHLAPSSTLAGRVRINDYCFIGTGSTIIDQLSVATGTILGAGSTLIRNVEKPNGIYTGVPAQRKIK